MFSPIKPSYQNPPVTSATSSTSATPSRATSPLELRELFKSKDTRQASDEQKSASSAVPDTITKQESDRSLEEELFSLKEWHREHKTKSNAEIEKMKEPLDKSDRIVARLDNFVDKLAGLKASPTMLANQLTDLKVALANQHTDLRTGFNILANQLIDLKSEFNLIEGKLTKLIKFISKKQQAVKKNLKEINNLYIVARNDLSELKKKPDQPAKIESVLGTITDILKVNDYIITFSLDKLPLKYKEKQAIESYKERTKKRQEDLGGSINSENFVNETIKFIEEFNEKFESIYDRLESENSWV